MPRIRLAPGLLLALVALTGCAWHRPPPPNESAAVSIKEPPGGKYVKASSLAALPSFFPGLGTLYVDPKTVPVGPWLAYDHQGQLVSTLYMVPLSDLDAHKKLADLKASGRTVESVDFMYNAGHPGVAEPHYHVILWHLANGRELVAH